MSTGSPSCGRNPVRWHDPLVKVSFDTARDAASEDEPPAILIAVGEARRLGAALSYAASAADRLIEDLPRPKKR